MKKKVVIRVQVNCDKCRSKALKIAAAAPGVISVSLDENDNEKLVVTGEVDAICLAKILKKKFKCVVLVSVEDVKPPKEPEKKPEKKPECKIIYWYPRPGHPSCDSCKLPSCDSCKPPSCPPCPPQPCPPCPPQPCRPCTQSCRSCTQPCHGFCDEQSASNCFIM